MQHAISFRPLIAVLVFGALLLGLLTAGAGLAIAQDVSQDRQNQQDQAQLDDDSSDTSSSDDATGDVSARDNQSAAEGQYGRQSAAEAQYNDQQTGTGGEACENPTQLLVVGPDSEDSRTRFETTRGKFRASFDIDFAEDDGSGNRSVRINVEDSDGSVVASDPGGLAEDVSGDFVVTEGAGTFFVVVSVAPPRGATYTVTIEECREGDVIDNTIPKKRTLAKTGGVPLPAVTLLALALVGIGLSVLRHAAWRDDA